MSVFSSRGTGPVRHVVPHSRAGMRSRTGLVALLALGLLLVSGCGFGAQTLRPYTPAEGVNFDVGDLTVPDSVVHVRNLLIISRAPGEGIISATMVGVGSDTLVGISVTPYRNDNSQGAPAQVQLPGGVPLNPNQLQVLTEQSPLLTVSNPGLVAGLTADVTLRFAKAGSYTARAPVMDGNQDPYTSISPAPPAPAASASASPSS